MTKHGYKILMPFAVYDGKIITHGRARNLKPDTDTYITDGTPILHPLTYATSASKEDYFDYTGYGEKQSEVTHRLEEKGYIKHVSTTNNWGTEQADENIRIFRMWRKTLKKLGN